MNMKATQSVSAWESVCPVAIIIVIMNFIKRQTRLYTGQKKREKGVIFLQNKGRKIVSKYRFVSTRKATEKVEIESFVRNLHRRV